MPPATSAAAAAVVAAAAFHSRRMPTERARWNRSRLPGVPRDCVTRQFSRDHYSNCLRVRCLRVRTRSQKFNKSRDSQADGARGRLQDHSGVLLTPGFHCFASRYSVSIYSVENIFVESLLLGFYLEISKVRLERDM